MIIRLRIGRWRFTWTMARTTYVTGVNSTLADGRHILMWDFDDTTLVDVIQSLRKQQERYFLPKIRVLNSGKPRHYVAYCFSAVEWTKAVEIVCGTEGVDLGFIKYGLYRGKFTLRVTPKCSRRPFMIHELVSPIPENIQIENLRDWVHYETLEDGENVEVHELRLWGT